MPSGGNSHSHRLTILTDGEQRRHLERELERIYQGRRRLMANPVLRMIGCLFANSQMRDFLRDRTYLRRGHTNTAIHHYECGLAFADQAIASGLEAEGWHMKSEHLGQLCLLKDFRFLVASGNKVREYARRALSLDTGNVSCHIILAADKIYSPRIFGGSLALLG